MMKIIISAICFFALGISVVFSADTKAERYAKEMAKYKQTDKYENCIRPSSIKRTVVLDDKHIIFEMRGKKAFLNTLPYDCKPLGFTRQFGYQIRGSRLCGLDIISVFDSSGPRGSCGLGKFQELEKLPKSSG